MKHFLKVFGMVVACAAFLYLIIGFVAGTFVPSEIPIQARAFAGFVTITASVVVLLWQVSNRND